MPVVENQEVSSSDEDFGFGMDVEQDMESVSGGSDGDSIENMEVDSDSDGGSEEEDEATYQEQLDNLQAKDASFYRFLMENDKTLLAQKEEPKEEEEFQPLGEADPESLGSVDALVEIRKSLAKYSLKSLKKLLMAFKSIDDTPKTFNLMLLTALKYAPLIFDRQTIDKKVPSASKKWKKVQPMVKSFLSSIILLLKTKTDYSITKFLVKSSLDLVKYYACFPKLAKEYLLIIVPLWQTSQKEELRILAFLCLRKIAIVAPNPYLNITIKSSHQAFLNSSQTTNHHTITSLMFMQNCVIELCSLHLPTTYQHLFVNLRQMAIKLRTSSTTKTKDSFKHVYNWQFLHSLRLWGKLLCTLCDPKSNAEKDVELMVPLVYPLVQIATGVMRLKPSAKYFPFRHHVIQVLMDLSAATGIYIPVSCYLLEVRNAD